MKLRDRWNKSLRFEKKMHIVIMCTIISVTAISIIVSTVSSILSLTRQSRQYAAEQLETMATDYESNLAQYKAMVDSIVLDQHVQSYCEGKTSIETYSEAGNVYSMLLNMLNIQFNANFIAVVNSHNGSYVYNGNMNIAETRFDRVYEDDYEQSIQARNRGTLRISFANNYSKKGKYTLTLYFPVYSTTHMISDNGLVILNLEDSLLERLKSSELGTNSNLYLTDIQGNIVSTQDVDMIGTQVKFASEIKGNSGEFWDNGKLVNYQRVGNWNYYLINEIPAMYLYQNSLGIVIFLLSAMMIVMFLTLSITHNLIKKLFRPMNKIVLEMNAVSEGNLHTRINTEDMDRDSLKMAQVFNVMMDEIDVLMKRVKEEQQQMDQMRLNALQSQIQPHFLYNTLECIHWQALSEGNDEVSTMVKALAQYYRICLSGGQEIIPLGRELDHIRNYLIIQNMRYDNIIELNIQVPERYLNIEIPKLTLQPLVENSIYHGIRVKEGRKGKVDIYVQKGEQDICIVVADDGEGMEENEIDRINSYISEFDRNIGYGINNVNKRIELMFGSQYGLKFQANASKGLRVEIHLPISSEESEHV